MMQKPLRSSVFSILILIGFALLVPYVAYKFIYVVSLKYSYLKSVPDVAVMLRYSKPLLFQIVLAIIPAILLLAKITDSVSLQLKKTGNNEMEKNSLMKKSSFFLRFRRYKFITAGIQIILALLVSGYILKNEFNRIGKIKVEIDYAAYQQDWEKVIALSKELNDYDRMVNFQFNRAMLNTGQVLDKIFEYEQRLGTLGMFLDVPFTAEITLPNSDLYFDLGNIDESLRYSFESETLMKNSPRVLKRLILNCIILDKTEAAKTYLNILKASPVEKTWAQKYYRLASDKELAANDPLIKTKRVELNKAEGMIVTPPLKLLHQLEKYPGNKKAIEYLIAFDLMEHDLVSLSEDYKYLEQFKYSRLPVALEEAIALFRSQQSQNEFLRSFRISTETVKRFNAFAKITKASGGDREKAKLATKDFKKTYWYYALFLSPRVTNVKLETSPVEANY